MAMNSDVEAKWLNPHQAAAYLGLTVKAVRERVSLRQLPFSKLGYSLRFDRDELDAFLKATAVRPINFERRSQRRKSNPEQLSTAKRPSPAEGLKRLRKQV